MNKRFLPKMGDHMKIHFLLIMFERVGAEGGGHLVEPLLQSFCKSHSALLRQIGALICFDVLTEFRGQLLLRLGIDIAENGGAVLFVPDDDTRPPAAIIALLYHAIPGRSAFRHGQLPSFTFCIRARSSSSWSKE